MIERKKKRRDQCRLDKFLDKILRGLHQQRFALGAQHEFRLESPPNPALGRFIIPDLTC
jgi:hypothetical protein